MPGGGDGGWEDGTKKGGGREDEEGERKERFVGGMKMRDKGEYAYREHRGGKEASWEKEIKYVHKEQIFWCFSEERRHLLRQTLLYTLTAYIY